MNAPTPRCFGKYEILETIDSGAMGVVYLAYDPVIDRRVAVKTIRRQTLDAVADISYEAGPGVIQRMYRQRMAAVQADFEPCVT